MATSDYQTFGDSGVDGVNKLSLANYTADADRTYGNGYTTKVIRSQLHNKVLQQVSKISAAVAQFLVNNGISALDTDSVSTLGGKLNQAVGILTDGSSAVQSSTKSQYLNYFTGTSTGALSIKITGLVTATAATVDLGFMEVTITQDDRDHSSATNPASYKFMIKGNMDVGVWYNTQAVLLGTNSILPINVRFTRTATDAYIEIGETTSTWYYATVEVAHVASYILAGFSPTFVATIQASFLGTASTDSTIAVSPPVSASTITSKIQPITASVGSNALTVTINPTTLDFRSTTLGSGTVTSISNSSPISVVVPASATLGTVSGTTARLAAIAINNAGTLEAAIVNLAGGNILDESGIINTTTISAGATSASVFYSTTGRTGVAYRIAGYLDITETTAGTWVTAPSTIQGVGGQVLSALSSLGYSQTYQNMTGSRTSGTTYYNTTGKPIEVFVYSITSAAGAQITPVVGGVTLQVSGNANTATCLYRFLVPVGASYSATINLGTYTSWFELR